MSENLVKNGIINTALPIGGAVPRNVADAQGILQSMGVAVAMGHVLAAHWRDGDAGHVIYTESKLNKAPCAVLWTGIPGTDSEAFLAIKGTLALPRESEEYKGSIDWPEYAARYADGFIPRSPEEEAAAKAAAKERSVARTLISVCARRGMDLQSIMDWVIGGNVFAGDIPSPEWFQAEIDKALASD